MTFDTNILIVIVAVLAVLIAGFLLMRPRRQRIERPSDAEPYAARMDRPYVKVRDREGVGVADEVAAATTDVAGDMLSVEAHRELAAEEAGLADDLQLLKGVGPKFASRLNELGVARFAQLATFSETELAHLDERLGPFRGRLARDRVAEQADYLARGDVEGFEESFGKIGEK